MIERPQVRHLSYCKKAKTRPSKSRRKACAQCIKAKTQCEVQFVPDDRHIQCTRCHKRGIDCHFDRLPFVTSENVSSQPGHSKSELEISGGSLSRTGEQPSLDYSDSNFEFVAIPNYELALMKSSDHPHNVDNSPIELFQGSTNTLSIIDPWTENIPETGYDELVSDAFLFHPDTYGCFLSSEGRYPSPYPKQDPFIFNHISPKPPKSFFPSRERDQRLQLTRRYVVCVIKSYPSMFLEHKLPPFIHQSCLASGTNLSLDISLPGPLSACVGIVQMFKFKNKSNTAFIWKTIRMEVERLEAQVFIILYRRKC